MNSDQLKELQANLMQSHHRRGAESNRTFLERMLRDVKQPDWEGVDPYTYWLDVGETYVLADYLVKAYQKQQLSTPRYQGHDQSIITLLAAVKEKMRKLNKDESDETAKGELSEMIEKPEVYYDEVNPCKDVEPILDSINRFRMDNPIPFDQADPKTIRQLYSLYQEVATIDPQTESKEEWQEKVNWLNWAAEQFTPLSQNQQMDEAKITSVAAMDQHAKAFQRVVPEPKDLPDSLPEEAKDALKNTLQAVDTLVSNIDRHYVENNIKGRLLHTQAERDKHEQAIKQAMEELEKQPSQPTLFGALPSPRPTDRDPSPPLTKGKDRQIER